MNDDDIEEGPSAGAGEGPVDDHMGAFGGSGFDPMRWQDDDLPAPAEQDARSPVAPDAAAADGDDWMPGEDAAPFEEGESLADLEGAAGDAAFIDDAARRSQIR